jgi:hypothetical protein
MTTPIITPPCIEDEQDNVLSIAFQGGDDKWLSFEREKTLPMVNGFIHDKKDEKFALLWGKEGFGAGHYVPIIEFVKEGEDEIEVLKNAVKAQTGGLEPTEFSDAGNFLVVIEGNPVAIRAKAYRITAWDGDISETLEKRPEWFKSYNETPTNASLPPIPIEKTFEDEQYFYPTFFASHGKRSVSRSDFAAPAKPEDIVGPLLRYWFALAK